ncbi:hypothetical protein ONZ45_g11637 [Pleurotus djamor]|nr:hypothetical protein ONZ45_g11637 [Pleurotus djamor]
MRKEWEDAHTVTEELVEGPPSRRANATLTACPNGNHLWCIGGEFFSEDGKAYFYNDVFRYSPDKDEWRKFVSPTCPGPRSAHAVVSSPVGGGKLFLFGGEFSSLHQNSFHHYRDFWCFDIATHSWDRIETKIRPSARSGHRMAMWKHYIVLFGGFYDPGITTRYLNDLWVFDTQEYKWQQIEFRQTDTKPSPRSGFSFLPTPDGILLHGGYCKEYAKGKRPVGVMLEDTWFLKYGNFVLLDLKAAHWDYSLSLKTAPETGSSKLFNPLVVKWERRKRPSTAYAPTLRSGCTMALWNAKGTGVLFGGVTDEDTNEETLESHFWNDLNGYQLSGKGRWVSMNLRRPKVKGGAKKKKPPAPTASARMDDDSDGNDDVITPTTTSLDVDPDDPILTTPLPRYNAMLAVLRNTLYIYGGIFEKGSKEYTLDDFHSLQLDKLDRYVCLKKSDVVIAENDESSSDDDDDEEDDDESDDDDDDFDDGVTLVEEDHGKDDGDAKAEALVVVEELPAEEEVVEEVQSDLRIQATAFMGVSKDTTRSAEDVISTPLPGETLAMFYARSREHWAQKALDGNDSRGKELHRLGFSLAQNRYDEYKPILQEVEKILKEAGLDEEEMRNSAAAGPMTLHGRDAIQHDLVSVSRPITFKPSLSSNTIFNTRTQPTRQQPPSKDLMTRSNQSAYSPKLARKTEKALSKQALKEGRIDRESVLRQSVHYRRQIVRNTIAASSEDPWWFRPSPDQEIHDKLPGGHIKPQRRGPGGKDESWNSGSYICSVEFDMEMSDIGSDFSEEEFEDEDEDNRRGSVRTLAIMEIAKQAKAKGVAKEFEVVEKPRQVIALDDNDQDHWEQYEEWEDLYFEPAEYKVPYAAVVTGSASGG